ncbi:MAG: cell division protein FtsZ, partial [Deltaproteobacteria bacterium]|nr:cell division protein FtsZ [Deltaproteobacteria bacterium]
TIPNEKLLGLASDDLTMLDAFKQADQILYQGVKGISDLITIPGLINLDFADVRTIMNEQGMALMGTGVSRGDQRAIDAATRAISSPLLEDMSIKGATGVLINISGGPSMTLREISDASKLIQEEAHEDANILFGAVVDESLKDDIRVTVIATGFDQHIQKAASPMLWRNRKVATAVRRQKEAELTAYAAEPSPTHETITLQTRVGLREDGTPVEMADYSVVKRHAPAAKSVHMKELIQEIGLQGVQEDEYDVPAFLRKQAD